MNRHANPFAPPVTDEAAEPDPPLGFRSVVPRVFGVLSIVFASLMLLILVVAALGAAMTARGRARSTPEAGVERAPASPSARAKVPGKVGSDRSSPRPAAAPARDTDPMWVNVLAAVAGLLFLALTPALLVIGIGQVRYRRWAVKATIVWAALALVGVACLLAMAIGRPMLTMIPSIAIFAPYPILLLAFFARERTISSTRRV